MHKLGPYSEELFHSRDLGEVSSKRGYHTAQPLSITHTEIQGWLRDLGHSLGYDVWIAANDRSRPWQDGKLGDGCLSVLPGFTTETQGVESVRLIDVCG